MKTLKDLVIATIEAMPSSELVELNNVYCRENNIDSEFYSNDEEFFDLFFENKAMEAVRATNYGEYNYTHDYVQFNGYGNLDSYNYIETKDLCENVDRIAEYAIDNQSEFYMIDFDALESELQEETAD